MANEGVKKLLAAEAEARAQAKKSPQNLYLASTVRKSAKAEADKLRVSMSSYVTALIIDAKPRTDLFGDPSSSLDILTRGFTKFPVFDFRAAEYEREQIMRSFPEGVGKLAIAAQIARGTVLYLQNRGDPAHSRPIGLRILLVLVDATAADRRHTEFSPPVDCECIRIPSDPALEVGKVKTDSTAIFFCDRSFLGAGLEGWAPPYRGQYARDYFDAIIVSGGEQQDMNANGGSGPRCTWVFPNNMAPTYRDPGIDSPREVLEAAALYQAYRDAITKVDRAGSLSNPTAPLLERAAHALIDASGAGPYCY